MIDPSLAPLAWSFTFAAVLLLGLLLRLWLASRQIRHVARHHAILDRHGLDYDLAWTLGGKPFLTPRGDLVAAMESAIRDTLAITPELSTTGGTSDGRFIADICPQVVEFGPVNATIHKLNECIALDAFEPLSAIYRRTLENLLTGSDKA